jgi:23S rRNA U2552 (ribose-2'-O)-methylase RlmE/FtsJ
MEPISAIANPEQMILDRALLSLNKGEAEVIAGVDSLGMSERCVEVPWAAALLRGSSSVLDIGFSMSPPEWMGVLLRLSELGSRLVGIDIIDPNRVESRYRVDQVSAVMQIPVRVEDFLTALPEGELFDTVACISTLEHIGIDRATEPSNTATVFERSESASDANNFRDPATDSAFLDAADRFLSSHGRILISVPAGSGGAILHQDSLGYYTHQFEYGPEQWAALISDSRFTVEQQQFYRYDSAAGWTRVHEFADLTDQTSTLMPYATGCAMVALRKII